MRFATYHFDMAALVKAIGRVQTQQPDDLRLTATWPQDGEAIFKTLRGTCESIPLPLPPPRAS